MDAIKFLKEKERMCESRACNNCIFAHNKKVDCMDAMLMYPERAVEVVEKWSKENSKTFEKRRIE